MPGVGRPGGPASFDGTAALGGVLANWSKLTAAQRAAGAVGSVRRRPVPRRAASVRSRSHLRRSTRPSRAPGRDDLRIAPGCAAVSDRGQPSVERPHRRRRVRRRVPGPSAAPAKCQIRLFPLFYGNTSEAFRSFVVAHEMFHCFEFAVAPGWATMPASVIEGMAEWAGLAVTNAAGEPEATAYLATVLHVAWNVPPPADVRRRRILGLRRSVRRRRSLAARRRDLACRLRCYGVRGRRRKPRYHRPDVGAPSQMRAAERGPAWLQEYHPVSRPASPSRRRRP